ncbi:MAG: hypothetical protein K1X29_07705 [Bdellovibrionales bacterium]|nr:hypothetical protein [Bdellovibrionales bacterium]
MVKNGYDQFFKEARKIKQNLEPNSLGPNFKDNSKRRENRKSLKKGVVKEKRVSTKKNLFLLQLAFLFLVVGLVWWTLDPELPEKFLKHVEVKWMGGAEAAESMKESGEKNSPSPELESAKTSPSLISSETTSSASKKSPVAEDFSHLDKLREQKLKLDLREKELNELEEELHKQRVELDQRIKQLEGLRSQISSILKERINVDQSKVSKLVETYSSMKPKQAADILSGLDEDLSVEILGQMKKKNSAEIMNLLDPAKARSLSEKYAGYKRQ